MNKLKQNICYLCKDELKNPEKEIIKEIRRDIISHWLDPNQTTYTYAFIKTRLHRECWDSLPISIKRRASGTDFTSRFLNTTNEIEVDLDENGEEIESSLRSLIPEIDEKILPLKEKPQYSEEDKKWLKKILTEEESF